MSKLLGVSEGDFITWRGREKPVQVKEINPDSSPFTERTVLAEGNRNAEYLICDGLFITVKRKDSSGNWISNGRAYDFKIL